MFIAKFGLVSLFENSLNEQRSASKFVK